MVLPCLAFVGWCSLSVVESKWSKWSECSHESHSNAGFRSRATSLGILKNRNKVCDKVEKAQAKAGDEWRWYALPLISTDIDWQMWKCEVWRTGKLGETNCKVFLSHSIQFDTYPCFDYDNNDNMSLISMLPGEVASLWILTCLRPFWFTFLIQSRGWGLENSACLQAFLSSFTPWKKSLQLNSANSDSDSILKPTLTTPAASIAYFQDGKCGAIRSALITSLRDPSDVGIWQTLYHDNHVEFVLAKWGLDTATVIHQNWMVERCQTVQQLLAKLEESCGWCGHLWSSTDHRSILVDELDRIISSCTTVCTAWFALQGFRHRLSPRSWRHLAPIDWTNLNFHVYASLAFGTHFIHFDLVLHGLWDLWMPLACSALEEGAAATGPRRSLKHSQSMLAELWTELCWQNFWHMFASLVVFWIMIIMSSCRNYLPNTACKRLRCVSSFRKVSSPKKTAPSAPFCEWQQLGGRPGRPVTSANLELSAAASGGSFLCTSAASQRPVTSLSLLA